MAILGARHENWTIPDRHPIPPLPARAGDALRPPPHAYLVTSAVFHYLGPSFAVLLFARLPVLGVAWLRIAWAALILALWRRPWRQLARLDRRGLVLVAGLGLVLAVMNACFYEAIDRLPLSTVAAIEFLGPIALALAGARVGRNVLAVIAAACGVYMLTRARVAGQPLGIAFAFANAALFAAYIAAAHRLARLSVMSGIDGLAAAMVVACLCISPVALGDEWRALVDPVALAAGAAVGICSSVIPYVFDQLAMVRLPRATYALLVALMPVTATLIGIAVLHQLPGLLDLGGIGLVITGVVLHRPQSEPGAPSPTRRAPAEAVSDPPQAGISCPWNSVPTPPQRTIRSSATWPPSPRDASSASAATMPNASSGGSTR